MKNLTIKLNADESELINKALKKIAENHEKNARESDTIALDMMYTEFARELRELASRFTY
jgi:allophanate hydrolase subunit 1